MSVLLVAGASGAGKTMTTREFVQEENMDLPVIHLDSYRDIILAQVRALPTQLPRLEIESFCEAATKQVCFKLVSDLLETKAQGLLDGAWVNPESARELKETFGARFSAIYCGYPRAEAHSRYERIKADGLHHMLHKADDVALEYIEGQIKSSRWFEGQALDQGFDFVDFTDIEQGRRQLRKLLSEFFSPVAA